MEKPKPKDEKEYPCQNPLTPRVSIYKWKPDAGLFKDLDAWLGRQGESDARGLDIPSK